MAIIGLGTDIAEIARIEAALERTGDSLARRILTEFEYQCFTDSKRQARYLAKRFAAKEAAAKALGTGIAAGVSLHDFEVRNDEQGKPYLVITGQAQVLLAAQGDIAHHLSISDEKRYAVATVIFESRL
ncbi:Holo-[acyl-carrier-protein] synthase [Vibrio stylophorae]|jgi:holo-[acyl-carrier protein] synthase|uniref:Holo-[acyl-carrier-protein] synthase n=1 Tax=Vibrio stylophorae TaxID=659351 RepID=A0ABN8DUA7_9VIBR|nr:holo-ACP synthase [Vibrio stylophorae]CAH0534362.1 Holo-[acyl-carrier-protein] synthase [Vibrio stylophorae]